ISIYIDSRGGNTASAEQLLSLLTASNQDSASPCRLITVVTSRAASAAADLLSSGDYAVSYAGSTILYHGVRNTFDIPLTAEFASLLSENLKLSNDRYAMALVRKSEWRFMYRFVTLRNEFDQVRAKTPSRSLTDLECFLELLQEKTSQKAGKVL